jgi:HK97 family phage major capsid protein
MSNKATIDALTERYNRALAGVQELQAKHAGKPDSFTADEEAEFDKRMADCDSLIKQIERLRKADELEAWGQKVPETAQPVIGSARPEEKAEKPAVAKELKLALFRAQALGTGYDGSAAQQADAKLMNSPEAKAYQADVPTGGGFAILPQEMIQDFLLLMKNLMFVRQLATVYEVPTADSLGVPALDTDPSATDWTVELGTGNEETTASVGKREWRPHPMAKLLKLSRTLIRKVPNFETVLVDRLAYMVALTEENAFLNGTGANQPLGVMTPSAQGIPTTRDVTAASPTAIAGDDIMGTFYNLKAQYRQRSSWIISRPVVAAVRKLKDANSQYIWQPGLIGTPFVTQGTALIGGTPDTLMGRPIYESELMPSTIAASQYVAILGDFSKYWIADALTMTLQVLYELYAATNQIGYVFRKETDGMPVLGEAFSRLIMHS